MHAFVIGNVALDETYSISALPEAGASIFGAFRSRDLGGKGCNQAIVLARCGLATTLVAAVGSDDRGLFIRDALAGEPLAHKLIVVPGVASDHSIILCTADGDNAIITTRAAASALDARSACEALTPAQPGDLLVLQGNLSENTSLAVLRLAKTKSMISAFNPSPLQPWFSRLLAQTDIVFLNETEADMFRLEHGSDPGADLRAAGVSQVVFTLGAAGSLLVTEQERMEVPATATEVVDTTGAGDCFMATALASALLRGRPIDRSALEHAAQAAAITVSRPGTQGAFPSSGELKALLRR